jgi:hypothetical protein
MSYRLSNHQRHFRATLFQLWAGAYEFAGGELALSGDVPDVAKLFFAKFICGFHSDLALSEEEQEVSNKLINCISDELLIAVEKKLAAVSLQTGVETKLLRAMVHGVAFARAAKQRDRLVDPSLAGPILQTATDCLLNSVEQLRRKASA